jgi:Family of unknown function (DUF6011)
MPADPTCRLCGGTGAIPPFMDDCSCVGAPVAPIVRPTSPAVGAMHRDSATGKLAVWSGTEWKIVETESLTPAEYAAKYGAPPVVVDESGDLVEGSHRHAAAEDASWVGDLSDLGPEPEPTPSDPYAAIAAELSSLGVGEVVGPAPVATGGSHAVVAWAEPAASEKLMTLAQATLMKRLVAERDPAHPTVKSANLALSAAVSCSARMASKLIDDLMLIPRTVSVPRPNKFSGTCRVCHGPVAAGAGQIVKVDGKWRTQHLDGGCLSAEDAAKMEADKVTEPGLYKLQEISAEGVTTTVFRVRKSRSSTRLYAERIIVDAESKAVRFAYHGKAIHLLSKHDRLTWAEARDFGAAYGSCIACGRTLSDARSLVQGYGATCAGHYSWPTVTNKVAEAIIAGAFTWEEAIAAKGFV